MLIMKWRYLRIYTLCLLLVCMSLTSELALSAGVPEECKHLNHAQYVDELKACIRISLYKEAKEQGVDCVECLHDQAEEQTNSWVDALSVLAQPLAYLGASYISNKQNYKINQAWADAYESGHKECTSRYQSFLDYNSATGANPITIPEAAMLNMTCMGNGYNQYAGYGGYIQNGYGGYYNPLLSSGYSSGFLGGMYGGAATGYYGYPSFNGYYGMQTGPSYYGSIGLNMNVGSNLNTSGNIFSTSQITDGFKMLD